MCLSNVLEKQSEKYKRMKEKEKEFVCIHSKASFWERERQLEFETSGAIHRKKLQ